jgi:hypothetical protein
MKDTTGEVKMKERAKVMEILNYIPTPVQPSCIVALIHVLPPFKSKEIPAPDQQKWMDTGPDKKWKYLYRIEIHHRITPIEFTPIGGSETIGTVPFDILEIVRSKPTTAPGPPPVPLTR